MKQDIINFDLTLQNIDDVKIFFGKYDGIQRYDRFKYNITRKLVELQQAQTWFPTELNYGKDKITVVHMDSGLRDVYQSNLAFQTLADSLANRYLDNTIAEHITSPEWEAVIKWQAHYELLHSESYSHNIREVYGDPEAFFKEMLSKPEIRKRLNIEIEIYKDFNNNIDDDKLSDFDKKLLLFKTLIAQYGLENIRFMISFLYTYKINDITNSGIPGTTNSITLIANDEFIHTVIFKHLINIIIKEKNEGFQELFNSEHYEETRSLILDIFKRVIENELEWFDYLSSLSHIDGMNREQITDFLHHYANEALNAIVLGKPFERLKQPTELIEFFEKRRTMKGKKILAMENDNTNYSIGVLEDIDPTNEDLSLSNRVTDKIIQYLKV